MNKNSRKSMINNNLLIFLIFLTQRLFPLSRPTNDFKASPWIFKSAVIISHHHSKAQELLCRPGSLRSIFWILWRCHKNARISHDWITGVLCDLHGGLIYMEWGWPAVSGRPLDDIIEMPRGMISKSYLQLSVWVSRSVPHIHVR